MAETIFSVFSKRRTRSFSTAATKRRMRRKASEKVENVKDDIKVLEEDFEELENELKEKLAELNEEYDAIVAKIGFVSAVGEI